MSKKTITINFEDYHKYEMNCFECSRLGIKNKIFYDHSEYQQHHIEEHQVNTNGSKHSKKTKKLKCSECNKQSASWYNFCAHITTHRDHCQPPWICTILKSKSKSDPKAICGKSCSTRHNLIKHQEGFHGYTVIYAKKNASTAMNKTINRKIKIKNKNKNKNKNRNRNRVDKQLHKPTVIAEPAPCKFVSENCKTDNNSSKILNTQLDEINYNKPKRKKLRPKFTYNKNDMNININKKRLRNNNIELNQEPSFKRQRIQKNNKIANENNYNMDIQSQINFLHLLHKAAMHLNNVHLNNNEEINNNINQQFQYPINTIDKAILSPTNSSLSPASDITM